MSVPSALHNHIVGQLLPPSIGQPIPITLDHRAPELRHFILKSTFNGQPVPGSGTKMERAENTPQIGSDEGQDLLVEHRRFSQLQVNRRRLH